MKKVLLEVQDKLDPRVVSLLLVLLMFVVLLPTVELALRRNKA